MSGEYLSTDPNAGAYLSNDPNAGAPVANPQAPAPAPRPDHSELADLFSWAAKNPGEAAKVLGTGWLSTLKDYAVGAGKGVANTTIGLGDMVNAGAAGVGLMNRDAAAFDAARQMVAPSNDVQRAGQAAEQIAEFAAPIPGGARAVWAARALEAAKGALVAGAQTGSPEQAAVAAAAGGLPIAEGAAWVTRKASDKAVRAVLKPAYSLLSKINSAGGAGVEATADELVDFVISNKLATPEQARKLITRTEQQIERAFSVRNPPTDAPSRAKAALDALDANASKLALPDQVRGPIRAKMEELLRGSMAEEVMVMGPNGLTTARVLRPSSLAKETLDSARESSLTKTGGHWGAPKDAAEGSAMRADKAVEKAQRDAVKDVMPELRGPLRTQGHAIDAQKVLDRAAWREGNREAGGLIGAVEKAHGGSGILGLGWTVLRSGQLRGGIYAGQLARALERGNGPEVANVLQKLGFAIPSEALR